MKNKEYKHFNAVEVFKAIADCGGPDLWNEYKSTLPQVYSQKLYFPDWYVINEFQTRTWALWWEKAAEVMGIQPGDSVYLDM